MNELRKPAADLGSWASMLVTSCHISARHTPSPRLLHLSVLNSLV